MSSISSEAPSSRALRHLNNRNNAADLTLRRRLAQMEREKNFYMSYLDKDRLDITDFLKNLQRCDSDDLPQSKIIKEEQQSDDDLSDDTSFVRPRRKTHTAKTAPPRLHVRRYKTDDDDDDDDDDCRNLTDHHPRRQIRTGVPTRREMLVQKRREERRAMESDYEKSEIFLRKLRQEAAKEEMEEFRKHVTQREFTAYLLRKIRTDSVPGDWFSRREWEAEKERVEEGDRKWANSRMSRMDMVTPMKRLGNIASLFQQSGRNTPAGDGGRTRWFGSPLKKLLGEVAGRSRHTNPQQPQPQRQQSIFEITEDDPPPSLLPRPAGMPDINRTRRDTLSETARAYGFGEAAVVATSRATPVPEAPTPAPFLNPFSRAALAERKRLERQAKLKSRWQPSALARATPTFKDDPHGTEMLRTLMQMKSHFRHKPLDDRIKDFMRELDDLENAGNGRLSKEDSDSD